MTNSALSALALSSSEAFFIIDEKSAREKLEGIILEYKKASNKEVLKGVGK